MAQHRDPTSTYALADCSLDGFESGLLTVIRHFCVSFADPNAQGWIHSFGAATHMWGISSGPKAAQAAFYVLDAMRRARGSVFQYNNPACPHCSTRLTSNERHMMQMLHAVRRGHSSAARIAAMLLVEGGDGSAMLAAAYNFACLFPVDPSALLPTGEPDAMKLSGVH